MVFFLEKPNPNYINLLAKIYENAKTKVRTDLGFTELIEIFKGVKQGDILSALLFCIVLMVILTETFENTKYRIKIAGIILIYAAFADDLALVTYTTNKMNEVLNRLKLLDMSITKTKYMPRVKYGSLKRDQTKMCFQIQNTFCFSSQFKSCFVAFNFCYHLINLHIIAIIFEPFGDSDFSS